jgi:hypothetical protein
VDAVVAVAGFGGSEAEGERADQVAQLGLELEPGGGFVRVDVDVVGEIQHRLHRDVGVRVAAPLADLFGSDRTADLLEPGEPAGAKEGGVFEVDVQHHLALVPTGPALGRLSGCVCQVKSRLVAGEVAHGDGAADVEGLGRTQQKLLVCVRGDRGLQVQGVGQVDIAVDLDPARQARVAERDVEVPVPGRGEAFGFSGFGVEPGLGFLDEPAQLGGSDLVRERGDPRVDERGRLRWQADGAVRDERELPRRQVTGYDPGPRSRSSWDQLNHRPPTVAGPKSPYPQGIPSL